jgi:hypothetical protein
MKISEKADFLKLVGDVHGFYGKPFNPFSGAVWWESLKAYDFAAVSQAFSRHAVNPDSGQFCPKPADVVRMIGGTSADAALLAWSKVERAIRSVGQYQSVVFDDPLIHRVAEDMGGWVKLCSCPSEDDFVFVAKEFQNRYRGFSMRNERPPYPPALVGLAQSSNTQRFGASVPQLLMIGDPVRCQAVFKGGNADSKIGLALLDLGADSMRQLGHSPAQK